MKRNYIKFKRGFNGAIKERANLHMDSTMSAIQWGVMVGALIMFFIRWLAVSSIAFGVFRYAEKVIEWAYR